MGFTHKILKISVKKEFNYFYPINSRHARPFKPAILNSFKQIFEGALSFWFMSLILNKIKMDFNALI